jgi:hypothetical protein
LRRPLGTEAAKEIKKLMPTVPIILCSLHDEQMFGRLDPLDFPVDRVLHKADIARLMSHVRDLVLT